MWEAEAEDGVADAAKSRGGVIGRMGGRDAKKVEEDYELFLRDIEEDEEIRAAVNMYKAPGGSAAPGEKAKRRGKAGQQSMDVDEAEQSPAQPETMAETDNEEDEADFPEVKLAELLEDFDEMTLGNDGEEAT